MRDLVLLKLIINLPTKREKEIKTTTETTTTTTTIETGKETTTKETITEIDPMERKLRTIKKKKKKKIFTLQKKFYKNFNFD